MEETTFEKLDVFQRVYKISLELHQISVGLPKYEQFGLAEQIRRASKAIPANLAEGYGKRVSKAEFRRFIQIAIGSADEMRVWLRYCFDLGYISKEQWHSWKAEYHEVAKMLNGLSRSLD